MLTETPDTGHAPMRQSTFGRASFLIGLFVVLGAPCVLYWVLCNWGRTGPNSPVVQAVGNACLAGSPLLSLVGVSLGIASFFKSGTKKALGIIGVILNGAVAAVALFIIMR